MERNQKTLIYVAAWLLTFFITDPHLELWSLIYIFPLGLAAFFNRRWGSDGGWWIYGFCIAVYAVHGWFYFRSRTRRSTLLLLGVLVILFLINVPGCRSMINTR